MLAAVLAGPEAMLDGYDPDTLLPNIGCPTLLLQADPLGPLEGGVMRNQDVELGCACYRTQTMFDSTA